MSVGSSVAQKVMHEAGALRIIGKDKQAVSKAFNFWGIFSRETFKTQVIDEFVNSGGQVLLRDGNKQLQGKQLAATLEKMNIFQRAWYWVKGITGRISNFAGYAAKTVQGAVSHNVTSKFEGLMAKYSSIPELTKDLQARFTQVGEEMGSLSRLKEQVKTSELEELRALKTEIVKQKAKLLAATTKFDTEGGKFVNGVSGLAQVEGLPASFKSKLASPTKAKAVIEQQSKTARKLAGDALSEVEARITKLEKKAAAAADREAKKADKIAQKAKAEAEKLAATTAKDGAQTP
jgi:hypothetical protein